MIYIYHYYHISIAIPNDHTAVSLSYHPCELTAHFRAKSLQPDYKMTSNDRIRSLRSVRMDCGLQW